MRRRSQGAKMVALVLTLQILWLPVQADEPTATITGVVRSADLGPLEGARVLVLDPETGDMIESQHTGADGNFTVADLSPGTYEIAVAVGEGLYLVSKPVYLVAGVTRSVQVSVDPATADPADATARPNAERLPSIWNNSVTAAFLVFGMAVLVGVMVENLTDDEPNETPVTTN